MKNRAIVTGGCGFIGSHLVDLLLQKDYAVTVIDNMSTGRRENLAHVGSAVEIIQADISEKGTWASAISDGALVFHLAALADIVPSVTHPEPYFRSNVVGTYNVVEACRHKKIRKLVYAASSSCYGIPTVYPTPESAEMDPKYPYALTKRLGEELVLHFQQVYGLPATSLRFFNVYGPRSRTSGTYGAVFGVFLAQKLANKPFTIVGDGTQTRDFTFVTDVAAAVFAASQRPEVGGVFNVGSGATVSVNRIAELLGGEKVHIPERPGEPKSTYADISKITRELGWKPTVPIEAGVREVLKNIEYWRNAPVWTPESIAEQTKEWFKQLKN